MKSTNDNNFTGQVCVKLQYVTQVSQDVYSQYQVLLKPLGLQITFLSIISMWVIINPRKKSLNTE